MAERNWVLRFEQWPGGGRFHVRRPSWDGIFANTSFFCGLYMSGQGPTRFEDELAERDMCKTCRKRAIAAAEKELREAEGGEAK